VDAVEVVHGEWIRVLDEYDVESIECPICGGVFYDGDNDTFDKPYNYCPNCGAKMDLKGEQNES
jgi:Zn-finger nucleic acid-binding protein